MPIRLLFRKPKKAVMIGIAVLSAALFLAPIHADASTYTQHTTVFDISITNTWSAGADPMPVDITMSYSGSFELGYMNSADADSLPETIQIYYDGEYCGDAVITSVSNAEKKTRVFDYSVSVPFHFSSYDTATKSATIDFASELVEYSFGDNTLNDANHFYNGEYSVSEKALIDLDAIENSQITESSANCASKTAEREKNANDCDRNLQPLSKI